MRSIIRFDLSESNNPIIKIIYTHSDDVRDKIVKRFYESLGNASEWCRIEFINQIGSNNDIAIISPISPQELSTQQDIMWRADQAERGWPDGKVESGIEYAVFNQEQVDFKIQKAMELLTDSFLKKLREAGMNEAAELIYPVIIK